MTEVSRDNGLSIMTEQLVWLNSIFMTENSKSKISAYATQPGVPPVAGVKNIIAVASGKGGVGKSTTAVNLALALQADGARVGIVDADIYGPNQPQMLGVNTRPEGGKGKGGLRPVMAHGLQTISMGYLVNANTPMVWRGPMVSQALQQLVRETEWDDLDYLIVDMPPGTGDIQLTLAQKVPVSGVVIVTTPQEIAVLDARKGLEMFRKVNINVLGVVENMSGHTCSSCGHHDAIFGEGGAERMSRECGCELFGKLPLDSRIRAQADGGKPIVIADPESEIANIYREIARRVVAKLALQPKNYSGIFPKIVVE
jgi:ATP-binding protein involved in chromosome partitioning